MEAASCERVEGICEVGLAGLQKAQRKQENKLETNLAGEGVGDERELLVASVTRGTAVCARAHLERGSQETWM